MSEVHTPNNEAGYCLICCKGYAVGPHVCAPVSEDRLRNARAWAASRLGTLSGAGVFVAAIDELLRRRADQYVVKLPEYTNAIGDAGEAYLKSTWEGSGTVPPLLSGTFRWYELWDAMRSAVSYPADGVTREVWMAWLDDKLAPIDDPSNQGGWIASLLGSANSKEEMQRTIDYEEKRAIRERQDWIQVRAVRVTVHVGAVDGSD